MISTCIETTMLFLFKLIEEEKEHNDINISMLSLFIPVPFNSFGRPCPYTVKLVRSRSTHGYNSSMRPTTSITRIDFGGYAQGDITETFLVAKTNSNP